MSLSISCLPKIWFPEIKNVTHNDRKFPTKPEAPFKPSQQVVGDKRFLVDMRLHYYHIELLVDSQF